MLTVVTHNEGSPELRINFGVFAGRSATPAEIDALARVLLPELGDVTRGVEISYGNYFDIFNGLLTPEQLDGQ